MNESSSLTGLAREECSALIGLTSELCVTSDGLDEWGAFSSNTMLNESLQLSDLGTRDYILF